MEKTQKWIVVSISPYLILLVMIPVLWTIEDSDIEINENVIEDIIFGSLGVIIIAYWIAQIFPIYFMYKWATRYNLDNFGYKSQAGWMRHLDSN